MTYLSPKLESRKSPIEGSGLFAREQIAKGELILDFSHSRKRIVSSAEADRLYQDGFDHMYQIGDDQFMITASEGEPKEWSHVNHSCDPNCGWSGPYTIVAMRDITKGEEATLDYAMMESSDYSFECHCGSKDCRHVITGDDWRSPSLQEKYRSYFQEYLSK